MIHERLKGCVQVLRLVREYLATRSIRQSLNVQIGSALQLSNSRGPDHDAVLQTLVRGFWDDATDHAARFIDRLGRGFARRTVGTVKVAGHARDRDHHPATDWIAGPDHVIRRVKEQRVETMVGLFIMARHALQRIAYKPPVPPKTRQQT